MNQEARDPGRSVDGVDTPKDTSSALLRARDQMVIDDADVAMEPTVRMLVNMAFTSVEVARTETPTHGIDDGRTTTRTQQPHDRVAPQGELQPPMMDEISDEPDMVASSVPNG